jgi:putative acetyltransferase
MGEPTAIALRRATAADVPVLAGLYGACARELGPEVYSAAQVAAWASFEHDVDGFARYVLEPETWVAVDPGGALLGFAGADGHGEIRSLYVRPGHGRRGLGGALLARVLRRCRERGLTRLQAWVTPFSLPLLRRAGFELIATMQAPYQGVMFERYRVERIEPAAPTPS